MAFWSPIAFIWYPLYLTSCRENLTIKSEWLKWRWTGSHFLPSWVAVYIWSSSEALRLHWPTATIPVSPNVNGWWIVCCLYPFFSFLLDGGRITSTKMHLSVCWNLFKLEAINRNASSTSDVLGFIKSLGRIKENMKKTRHFIQMFVSLWKLLVFLCTMLILTSVVLPEGCTTDANLSSFLFVIKQGLHQFWSSAIPLDWISPFYIFVIQSSTSLLFYWFGTFACKIGAQVTLLNGWSFLFF